MNTKAVMSITDEQIAEIPRQPVWSGDGLPPVGTTCEAWHNGSAQGVVEVRYAGDFMVLWNVELKHEQCSAAKDYSFRPIRTPEQIAAEERDKAYRGMIDDLAAVMGISNIDQRECDVLHALVDAGYRKVDALSPKQI